MSKENVALFLGAIADNRDVNAQIARAPQTPDAWAAVARKHGYEFTNSDLHGVVEEVLDLEGLREESSVAALVAAMQPHGDELSDAQMESVAGGASFSELNLDQGLTRRLTTLGYPNPGALRAEYIQMPPMHIQTKSLEGFDVIRY